MPETNTEDPAFEDWPLHDAVVGQFVVDAESQTCRLDLEVFFERDEYARPAQIEWRDVTGLTFPQEAPWGRSAYVNINRQWQEEHGVYVIELQTGDEVRVTAGTASFQELRAV